jgi:hypothetical protein
MEPETVKVPTSTPTSFRCESVVAVEFGTLRMRVRPSNAKRTNPSERPEVGKLIVPTMVPPLLMPDAMATPDDVGILNVWIVHEAGVCACAATAISTRTAARIDRWALRTFIYYLVKAGNYPLKKADAAALERDVQRLLWNENIVLRTRQRQQLDKEAIRKARTVRELGVKANYLIALHTAEASSPVE